MTASDLRHAEDHMLLLGRKTAMEKVATFLLEMDRRLASAGMVALPMCRRDIGDYLGLTLESVSRALSQLNDPGGFQRPPDRTTQPPAARRHGRLRRATSPLPDLLHRTRMGVDNEQLSRLLLQGSPELGRTQLQVPAAPGRRS